MAEPVLTRGFDRQSDKYALHRPRYPDALFDYLAGLCTTRDVAWDCATGSGQAALGLVHHFASVIATDVSSAQIAHAHPHPRISYRVAPAHASGLADASVDIVTVATALHWLDTDAFYAEVRRVAKPAAVIAVWTYFETSTSPAIDRVLRRYRAEVVGEDWAFDVSIVAEGYRTIPFPFTELRGPTDLAVVAQWTLTDMLGYLESWSATHRHRERTGTNPVASIRPELAAAWGDPAISHTVQWPLFVRVGRVNGDQTTQQGEA